MTVVRLPIAPETCPKCGAKNLRGDIKGTRWTRYTIIPDAPAAGCGSCGHIVYVETAPVCWAPPASPTSLPLNKKRRR